MISRRSALQYQNFFKIICVLILNLYSTLSLACPSSLLHFKIKADQVRKIQIENPLKIYFQDLKILREEKSKVDLKILNQMANQPRNLISIPDIWYEEQRMLNLRFEERFQDAFRKLNSRVQSFDGNMNSKYTIWHAYVLQLIHILDFWDVRVIYSTPEQIICRGTQDHVIRFAKNGSLYKGKLDESILQKIESYGREPDPDFYNAEVLEWVHRLKPIKPL